MTTTIQPRPTAHPLLTDVRDVDPGLLVLAVSLMNLDSAYSAARQQLQRDDNVFRTLGKIAPLAAKVADVRNRVIQSELQAADSRLAEMTPIEPREVDSATISEADNQRFAEQQAWAAARGIELENPAKIVTQTIREEIEVEVEVEVETEELDETETTTDESRQPDAEESIEPTDDAVPSDGEPIAEAMQEESDGGTVDQWYSFVKDKVEELDTSDVKGLEEQLEKVPETVTKTVTKTIKKIVSTVIHTLETDLDVLQANKDKLARYHSRLQAGTADNATIRQAILDDPSLDSVSQTLAEIGQTIPFGSLQEVDAAIAQLRNWTDHLLVTVDSHLVTARTVHEQMEKLSVQITEHRNDAQRIDEEGHRQHLDQHDFSKKVQKFLETREERIPELLEVLRQAVEATEDYLKDIRDQREQKLKVES